MKTTIFFVRHGESEANAGGFFAGHMDVSLSPLGHQQAKACAESLKDVPFAAMYSSDLRRAHQTAEPHARLHGLPIVDDAELRELYCGAWEGMKICDIEEQYPEECLVGFRHRIGTFVAPGGESVAHLTERFRAAVLRLCERHAGQTILITSHALAISSFFFRFVYGLDEQQMSEKLFFPGNATYSVAVYENGVFTPISYSVGKAAAF